MKKDKAILLKNIIDRGFYNPYDVFHHAPEIYDEPDGYKYQYKVHIIKWNTSSTGMTILGARWDEKQDRYILSTYKTGSIKRYKHGEKMR